METTPYDTVWSASTSGGGLRIEMRHLGGNRHEVYTDTGPDGSLIGKSEHIQIGPTIYSRATSDADPNVYGPWRILGDDLTAQPLWWCLDPNTIPVSGASSAPHTSADFFLSEEEGSVRREIWADAIGQPVRERRTFYAPGYDGVTVTDSVVMEITFSDYNVPNVIEPPCANAAPDEADNPALMRDCLTLLAARDTLRGTASLNWDLDTSMAEWDGVVIGGTPSRVIKLWMEDRDLDGSIPPALGDLDALEHLYLYNNDLTGTIPPELGRLSVLRRIYSENNNLTGSIPPELGNMTSLQDLWLYNNDLTGSIPPELGNASAMLVLGLNDNDLTGVIPATLADLEKLQVLWLHGNGFTGCVPLSLRNIENNDVEQLGLPDCAN